MILCACPQCGRRELRGPRSLFSVATPTGDVLALACRRCDAVVSALSSRLLRPAALDVVA